MYASTFHETNTIVILAFLDFQDCDFENGLCLGWENLLHPEDNLDWSIIRGRTPSALTGPTHDHTLGTDSK